MRPAPWGPFALGDGPDACLLLHGFTGSPLEVRPLGEALARAGLRAVAPLLPGHGASPAALAEVDRHDLYEAAREALRELRGARRVFVAGLSAGALLALELCARERLREGDPLIEAIALLAPAIKFAGSTRLFASVLGRLPRLPLPLFLDKGARDLTGAPAPVDPGPAGEELDSAMVDPAMVASASDFRLALPPGVLADGSTDQVPLSWARELRLLSTEALALARRVRQPALILHGLLDRTTDPAGSRLLAGRLASREVELRFFDRSGHVMPLDAEGPEVCAAVTAFFTRKRPGIG